ncbi:MAG: SDR family oxidoreductase [Acidobacteria bacterium]|nr:SDR family oxidoreductase [Acidobacteriota bacterium]
MKFKQKPLEKQTIVLTGATSGIGLVTARMAAKKGARLVLIARNQTALSDLTDEINSNGGDARFAVVDVASEPDLRLAAGLAQEAYGGFDTWINNAGVSIYGNLEDVPTEDSRRLFETNFWGVVNGSLIAAKRLHEKGGTIINLGSTLSDRAIPLQGMYCASKHAVKGFTDALRMELEASKAPILLTLIKPAAIDTPYKQHAKNYLGVQPENPPPVYAPETVAETILFCAENPVRDIFVGGGGKALSAMGEKMPRLTDLVMENTMIDIQKTDEPQTGNPLEGLYSSHDDELNERGGYDGHVAESSLYTKASLHPVAAGAAVAVGLGALFAIGRGFKNFRDGNDTSH